MNKLAAYAKAHKAAIVKNTLIAAAVVTTVVVAGALYKANKEVLTDGSLAEVNPTEF